MKNLNWTSVDAKALTDQSVLKPPVECGNDQYTQWLSRLWKEGAKIVDEKARRFIHSCRVNLDVSLHIYIFFFSMAMTFVANHISFLLFTDV